MRNVKAIIFDLGRVMVRIDPTREKFASLMRAIGVEPEEAFNKFWYVNEVRQLMTGDMTPFNFYQTIVQRFGLEYSYEQFIEGWCDLFTPMPGMREIFEEAGQKHRLGILSDTDSLHWLHLKRQFPWLGMVEKPTLSFEVGLLKPHPDMFAAAAKNCGCEKHECLFIDDMVANVDGARYFGMLALQFTSAEKLRKDLDGLFML